MGGERVFLPVCKAVSTVPLFQRDLQPLPRAVSGRKSDGVSRDDDAERVGGKNGVVLYHDPENGHGGVLLGVGALVGDRGGVFSSVILFREMEPR